MNSNNVYHKYFVLSGAIVLYITRFILPNINCSTNTYTYIIFQMNKYVSENHDLARTCIA